MNIKSIRAGINAASDTQRVIIYLLFMVIAQNVGTSQHVRDWATEMMEEVP